MSTVLAWARRAGVESYGLHLGVSEARGRGLFATEALPVGTRLVAVPPELLYTDERAKAALGDELVGHIEESLRRLGGDEEEHLYEAWMVLAAVTLLHQRQLEDDLAPFWEGFPRESEAPLTWSEDDLALLDYPKASEAVRSTTQWLRTIFLELWGTLKQHLGNDASWGMFLHAYCVVQSRALNLEGTFVLAPLVDMFNYVPGATNADFQAGENGKLEVWSTAPIAPDEEVLLDYGGRRSNDDLLLHYGFVSPDNPYDTVSLPLPQCALALEGESALRELLSFAGPELAFTVARTGVDLRVKRCLRVALMGLERGKEALDKHLAAGSSLLQALAFSFMAEPQDSAIELLVIQELRHACSVGLQAWGYKAQQIAERGEAAGSLMSLFYKEKQGVLQELQGFLNALEDAQRAGEPAAIS